MEEREKRLTTADLAASGEREKTLRPDEEMGRERGLGMEPSDITRERRPETPLPQSGETGPSSLFAPDDARRFRSSWDEIQVGFVDNPRRTVEQADHLVADVIKRLADSFASERSNLEQQWSRGGDANTEDLRVALQRYRSFFDRLLSM